MRHLISKLAETCHNFTQQQVRMVAGSYVYNILSLLCDGDEHGLAIREQLLYLAEKEYAYTRSGVFVYFTHMEGISDHKCMDSCSVFPGVKIRSAIGNVEAEAQFFLKDGLIDYLEIWCYAGDYPGEELTSYILTQEWQGSPGKRIAHNVNL